MEMSLVFACKMKEKFQEQESMDFDFPGIVVTH